MALIEDIQTIVSSLGVVIGAIYIPGFIELCININWTKFTLINPTPILITYYETIPVFGFMIASLLIFYLITLRMIGGNEK